MKQCMQCGTWAQDQEQFCKNCGVDISGVPCQPASPPPVHPQWTSYPVKKAFSWQDVCTILGFAASIIGYFAASILLLPLGLIASVIGFHGDKTKGLAVAGIVIASIGVLIKLVSILYTIPGLPQWFTNGVW